MELLPRSIGLRPADGPSTMHLRNVSGPSNGLLTIIQVPSPSNRLLAFRCLSFAQEMAVVADLMA
eukprot:scaffold48382_cov18-Tisochrysis_lutea.AAC.5